MICKYFEYIIKGMPEGIPCVVPIPIISSAILTRIRPGAGLGLRTLPLLDPTRFLLVEQALLPGLGVDLPMAFNFVNALFVGFYPLLRMRVAVSPPRLWSELFVKSPHPHVHQDVENW